MNFIDDVGNGQVHSGQQIAAAVPPSLEAYVAMHTQDPARTLAKLVEGYARSGLWTVISRQDETSLGMTSTGIAASLMIRRKDGLVSAAIAASHWSVMLRGTDAWIDVLATGSTALALIGKPVRVGIEIPFLAPTLIVEESSRFGDFYRFHCK